MKTGSLKHIKAGDIILLNRIGKSSSWFSRLQRIFTRMPYTHTALIIGDVKGVMSVLSADELVTILPLQKYLDEKDTEIEVFSTMYLNNEVKENIITELYYKYAGTYYGFSQVIWFLYRWFMEVFFEKDVRKNRNVWTSGTVCSELVWYYMDRLGDQIPVLKKRVNEWDPNTVHSGDMHNICTSLPNIFNLIYQRKK